MSRTKCTEEDYIQWLIAAPKTISCTEAAKTDARPIAHDAYTRLLRRLEPSAEDLWDEVFDLVQLKSGCLVADDSTLDKPYGPHIELVTNHWSGKHKAVVQGINLITLLWTDGDISVPVDWRVYSKKDGLTKNDHLRQMLHTARERGFEPQCVLFDSWYSSLDNLKLLRQWDWDFFAGLKSNRHVNPDNTKNRAIKDLDWPTSKQRVYLKGFGWAYAYRRGDGTAYFISSLELSDAQRQQKAEQAQQIENYHRGLKQQCNIERCQARLETSQRNHIRLAIRAFVRLARYSYRLGPSSFALKASIIRDAVRNYLSEPIFI